MVVLQDAYSEEEKKVLQNFCSNVERPIFVLKNLPEVIKGALFSRYSRSPKGLRRLLLDEFINSKEGSFNDIVALSKDVGDAGKNQSLAIKKAQDFYDRILDGYGDDSIGELGGAHLACEQVSIIASKVLEDPRIGGSPLEKSTRYIFFDNKVDGKYLFYEEPTLMKSKHKAFYLETMNLLFDTYAQMIEPMKKYIVDAVPRVEGISDAAYNFSVRAKACDALRGILPAGTLTNVGIFGNGRFYYGLIMRLKSSSLAEMHDLGKYIGDELNTEIPSFVRQAMENNKHFAASRNFVVETNDALKKFAADKVVKKYDNEKHLHSEEITLVDYDKDAEDKIIAALLYPHTDLSLVQLRNIVHKLGAEERLEILKESCSRRKNRRNKPGRAFENTYYTFDILCDYGSFRDLHRHRALTQERQLLTTNHGYIIPEEILQAGLKEKYVVVMEKAKKAFDIISKDFPEEAQYVVPLAYRLRWYFKMSLREVYWISEIRSSPQGHPTYRYVAQELHKRVREVHPALAEYMKFVDMNDYKLGRLDAEVKKVEKKEKQRG